MLHEAGKPTAAERLYRVHLNLDRVEMLARIVQQNQADNTLQAILAIITDVLYEQMTEILSLRSDLIDGTQEVIA